MTEHEGQVLVMPKRRYPLFEVTGGYGIWWIHTCRNWLHLGVANHRRWAWPQQHNGGYRWFHVGRFCFRLRTGRAS